MATVDMVLNALVAKAQDAVATMAAPPTCFVYAGWPQPEELYADVTTGNVHISVYPSELGERFASRVIAPMEQVAPPVVNLSATVSATQLQGGDVSVAASGTLTLLGSVNAGLISIIEIGGFYVNFKPTAGASLDVVAAAMASAINADTNASSLVTASAAGAIVTVTANTVGAAGNTIRFGLKIGGSTQVAGETGRRMADFQIHVWAFDNDSRVAVTNTVDELLAATTFIELADGTLARLRYVRTVQNDTEIKHGVYRRILHYTVEYVSTRMVDAVQVLEAQVTYSQM